MDARRRVPRFGMELPLEVRLGKSSWIEGKTRDVSARGVYFYLEDDTPLAATVEFTVVFPKEVTGLSSLLVRCTGNVVRIDITDSGKRGVAADIRRYEFIRTAEV